ncbi:phosphoadenosine phosphosulfate reductase [Serratia bockelmannii]|uniref:phosphoadenosine phosphosulfate reductase n=1 Tax=Serratia bockelmannii TaxID=2703793 RepID=UPI003F81BF75
MVSSKIPLGYDVLAAAQKRFLWTFNTFQNICLSFSGGKDSTVMFHLAAACARQLHRRFHVLFIDWEAQFSHTISHVEVMKETYHDVVESFYWVALPLRTASSVSLHQPEWICWQPGVSWVRQPPTCAIVDTNYFPFYKQNMTFEEFIPSFAEWFTGQRPAAMLVGIRADESLQRFQAIANLKKMRFADDKPWTTATPQGHAWNIYPLYDWKTEDIWTWFALSGKACNPLYNLMYQAGVPLRLMRVCEPFGPEQRRGLWLYHVLEPERWALLCHRVAGANCGKFYANRRGDFFAVRQLNRPDNHNSWRSYALFLLDSLPQITAEHYRNKISVYLRWYRKHGFPEDIPDEQEKDLGSRDIPSWRRICKVLLRNDFWCRALSFSPNKASHYVRYCQRIQKKRQRWGLL